MIAEAVLALEFVRMLEDNCGRNEWTAQEYPAGDQPTTGAAHVRESAFKGIIVWMDRSADRMPTRREAIDWFGRRLIT